MNASTVPVLARVFACCCVQRGERESDDSGRESEIENSERVTVSRPFTTTRLRRSGSQMGAEKEAG